MDKLVINGGNKLRGEVNISGAKNSALPIIAGTALVKGRCVIDNVPNIKDVDVIVEILRLLGAKVVTVNGDDVPYQIAEFARLSGVTKIVIGRSAAVKKHLIRKPTLTEKLIAHAPNIDIHIIPDSIEVTHYEAPDEKKNIEVRFSFHDLIVSIGLLIAATLLGYVFFGLGFTEANIITVYILGVLLTSILT